MKGKEKTCREVERLLGAYYDGELDSAAAGECEAHLRSCPRCRRLLQDYRAISRDLAGMAAGAGEGGEVSLWPAIRRSLEAGREVHWPRRAGGRPFFVLRPAWLGVGLSAAAALAFFFSGVFTGRKLPANYCRIESIAAPEHNLMIHPGQGGGPTVIWLSERGAI